MSTEGTMKLLLGEKELADGVERIANAICQEFFPNGRAEDTANLPGLLGIQAGGIPLARRIAKLLKQKINVDLPVGVLDITMYRDDIGTRRNLPLIRETEIPFNLDGAAVILTDEVIDTGRSIRAALDAITDYGRPSRIRLAVLVNRGGHEFPITPDYAGSLLSVSPDFRVTTQWLEFGGDDCVYAVPREMEQK